MSRFTKEQKVQLERPAKVHIGAHIPGPRQKPKFIEPVVSDNTKQVIIEDDIELQKKDGSELFGFVGLRKEFEKPMMHGDVDLVRSAIADSESAIISEETTKAEPEVVSEEISANAESDEPQGSVASVGVQSANPVYRNMGGDIIGPDDEVAGFASCVIPGNYDDGVSDISEDKIEVIHGEESSE